MRDEIDNISITVMNTGGCVFIGGWCFFRVSTFSIEVERVKTILLLCTVRRIVKNYATLCMEKCD